MLSFFVPFQLSVKLSDKVEQYLQAVERVSQDLIALRNQ